MFIGEIINMDFRLQTIIIVAVKRGAGIMHIVQFQLPAERDFSLLNFFVGDPMRNRTSEKVLNAKMQIKAELLSLSQNCKKCKEQEKMFKEGKVKSR